MGSTLIGSQVIGVYNELAACEPGGGMGICRASGSTHLGGGEDVLDGNGDLRANAITLNQAHGVFALHRGG